jgi:hypothetical protein
MSIATHIRIPKTDGHGNPIIDPLTGRQAFGEIINPVKPFVRGFWMPGMTPLGSQVVTLAGNGKAELEFLIDFQGHFEWAYIMGVSTGAYSLKFFDNGRNRELQNRPIHSSLIVGSAQRPFKLPEPYFLNVGDSQRTVKCTITDLTGSTNTVRLVIYGRRWYHKEAEPDIAVAMTQQLGGGDVPYTYFLAPEENDPTTGLGVLVPANGTRKLTFQSDAHSDTELTKWMAISTGPFTVLELDNSKNKFLMNDEVHSDNAFGNAEFPFIPADSFLLERQKYLIMTVKDISGAPNRVTAAAAGRRLTFMGNVGR